MELVRAIVQKILRDKILMGLVVIGILGFFVGGMTMGDDKETVEHKTAEHQAQLAAQHPSHAAAPQAAQMPPNAVEPKVATDFVKWWVSGALDYNASTAASSHAEVIKWVTPDIAPNIQKEFWNDKLAQCVASGQFVGAFQPTSLQPLAINPDGSVVVTVQGSFVTQQGTQPSAQQFNADVLVKNDGQGLRMAGLYNKSGPLPGSSIY